MIKQISGLIAVVLMVCWQCTPSSRTVPNTGFNEKKYIADTPKKFPDAEYEHPLPQLKDIQKSHKKRPNVKIIDINNSKGCRGWADCGINDKKYNTFLIHPGDYRSWGPLKITTPGNEKQYRIISHINANPNSLDDILPVNTKNNEQKHVIIEALNIAYADYWIINGITFSGNSEKTKRGRIGGRYSRIAAHANYNIINRCLFENVVNHEGALDISFSDYNHVQNSIVRNLIGGDQVGILIKGKKDRAIGNKIVNNEIYDCNDGIQLTYRDSYGDKGYVSGTVIENNDIYLNPKSYSKRKKGFACAENGIDIKIGGESASPKDVVRVLRNRIWGFRPTDPDCGGSGGRGRGITLTFRANNVILKDNILSDLPNGIGLSNERVPNTRIAVLNNLFFDIKKFDKSLKFAPAIRASVNADIYYNTIKGSQADVMIQAKSVSRVQCNTVIGVAQNLSWSHNKKGWSALNAWYDCNLQSSRVASHDTRRNIVENRANTKSFGDFVFYRKRWTKPEKVVVKNVFPDNQKRIKHISQNKINCSEGGDGDRWWKKCID